MTASQDLSETEEDFSLYKTQFKFETNPSADFTLKMYTIFVPEDDPTYQIWWMGDGVSLTLWTYDDAHPDGYARERKLLDALAALNFGGKEQERREDFSSKVLA